MSPSPAWSGAAHPRILILGEAWGEQEAMVGLPFVGSSGQELWRMLGEALPQVAPELHGVASAAHRFAAAWVRKRDPWLEAAGIAFANVFNFRPPDNKMEYLCTSKEEAGKGYPWPAYSQGKYIEEAHATKAMADLRRLLEAARPSLVIAMGNTACWAMLGQTNIGQIRGTTSVGMLGIKVLPTYHPAGVLRQWSWRPIVLADLMKAWRESQFPEVRRPARTVLVNPTEVELRWGADRVIREALAGERIISADVETKKRQITCISFAGSTTFGLVIPFVDEGKKGGSYWETHAQEVRAWGVVKELLEHPATQKLGQNFLYDLQYILPMAIRPAKCEEDTMLLHHAHFPELQKGLGFLGSIYTDEPAWKLMRRQRAADMMEKRDE